MILEAFSKYLFEADPQLQSTDVLARWLWEKLSMPPQTAVDQVIHCEIMICKQDGLKGDTSSCEIIIPRPESADCECEDETYVFRGSSRSGSRLLKSLREYCQSYEQQKWARWVHTLKASDFSTIDSTSPDEIGD